MAENLEVEGRYSVRTPMQWSAERNGGFSTVEDPSRLRRPLPSGAFGPDRVNVAAQRRDPHSLLNWFERLIRRRRECPELGFGALELLETGAPNVLAHRCDWEGATVVAVHELAGRAATITLPVTDGDALVDLLDEGEHALPATLSLDPYAARWFRVRRAGERLPP
jgi:maltose alpha-D-glucosyltransferase/alpha-amylase